MLFNITTNLQTAFTSFIFVSLIYTKALCLKETSVSFFFAIKAVYKFNYNHDAKLK